MSLKLLHLNASRSFRAAWAIHELGLADKTEFVRIDRPVGAPGPANFNKQLGDDPRNGLAKAPALIDSDGDVVVLESGAILQYLAERYGDDNILPPVSAYKQRATVLQWLHFAEATLMCVDDTRALF